MEKVKENIDRVPIFAYNRSMERRKGAALWTVRILLSVACAFAVGFILYNSIQPAVESAAQSSRVVALVQRMVAVIAPNSPIATATGAAYERLHAVVRTIAHFAEYAFLGALGTWCYRSYTDKKVWLAVPSGSVARLAGLDEFLQTLTAGRAGQFLDVVVDILGGSAGVMFALLTIWLGVKILKKRRVYETR